MLALDEAIANAGSDEPIQAEIIGQRGVGGAGRTFLRDSVERGKIAAIGRTFYPSGGEHVHADAAETAGERGDGGFKTRLQQEQNHER